MSTGRSRRRRPPRRDVHDRLSRSCIAGARVALAEWDGGRLTVWTGTQQPFIVRAELGAGARVHERDVRVIVPDLGGGFGSKHTEDVAIAAARLARAAGTAGAGRAQPRGGVPLQLHAPCGGDRRAQRRLRRRHDHRLGVRERQLRRGRGAQLRTWSQNQRIAFEPADSPLPQGSVPRPGGDRQPLRAGVAHRRARARARDRSARAAAAQPDRRAAGCGAARRRRARPAGASCAAHAARARQSGSRAASRRAGGSRPARTCASRRAHRRCLGS